MLTKYLLLYYLGVTTNTKDHLCTQQDPWTSFLLDVAQEILKTEMVALDMQREKKEKYKKLLHQDNQYTII